MQSDGREDPMFELSRMRKVPPVARSVSSAVGLVLNAATCQPSIPLQSASWLQRMGQDPAGTLEALKEVGPSSMSNAAIHSLMALLHKTPELSAEALDALAGTHHNRGPSRSSADANSSDDAIGAAVASAASAAASQAWAKPLAAFGVAVRALAAKCEEATERMPVKAQTVMVCVDGSRLSYLALEVAAALRKHGRLVVLHVQEAREDYAGNGNNDNDDSDDDQLSFLVADLRYRCAVHLNIPTHRFSIVTLQSSRNSDSSGDATSARSSSVPFKELCAATAVQERADVVVLGGYGTTGARIGTLGTQAAWATSELANCTTVLANPYANPVPALSEGGTDALRPQLFLLVLKAERPLNAKAIRSTMALMAPWHSLLLLVLLNEAQTRAGDRNRPAQPPIDKFEEDVKQILVDAQLSPKDESSSKDGEAVGSSGTATAGRSSVRIEPFDPTKTAEQLIVRCADSERADFIAMDRKDNFHSGVIKACRATVLLLPH